MMNILKSFFALLILFFFSPSIIIAQDSFPLLSGTVDLSVKNGTFKCDFTLSNIPRIEDYYIRINAGMNILSFRNIEANKLIYFEKSFSDTISTGETIAYYFPGNKGKGKFLPKAVEFKYVGMYPVIFDTLKDYSVEDWKGNIAFNGYSVRTDGSQSAWYPVLYNIKKDIRYDKVKYDITINCKDCNSLYVNGSNPIKGNKGQFKSDIPQQLTMFSGNYKIANVNGTYVLNPNMNEKQIVTFGEITNAYKHYYEENLKIPYNQTITYIQTTPTSKYNAWLFVSYPTIVTIGHGKDGLLGFFDKKGGDWYRQYIAHELAHYYFGSLKQFNASLADMMSEGFSEYLSLKITKNLISDSIYNKKIAEKIKNLNKTTPLPFGKINSSSDYENRNLYVYSYAPLIFLSVEKEIGEQKMWAWLKKIIETPTDFTDYAFLKNTLSSVLEDKIKFDLIIEKYFEAGNAFDNIVKQMSL